MWQKKFQTFLLQIASRFMALLSSPSSSTVRTTVRPPPPFSIFSKGHPGICATEKEGMSTEEEGEEEGWDGMGGGGSRGRRIFPISRIHIFFWLCFAKHPRKLSKHRKCFPNVLLKNVRNIFSLVLHKKISCVPVTLLSHLASTQNPLGCQSLFFLQEFPELIFFPQKKISVYALLQRPLKRRERNINPLAQLQEQQWSGEENQLHETSPKKRREKKRRFMPLEKKGGQRRRRRPGEKSTFPPPPPPHWYSYDPPPPLLHAFSAERVERRRIHQGVGSRINP